MGMMLVALAEASESVIPIKAVGVSANGWITAIVGVIASIIGTGGVYGIFKGLALLHEQRNARAKLDNEAASIVRKEMMEFNAALQKRVDDLEKAGREERKRWDDEMAAIRRGHAEEVISVRNGYEEEIRSLRLEIEGLRRQMAQWATSSQAAVELSKTAPTATRKRLDNSGMGEILRGAFDVPGVGEE